MISTDPKNYFAYYRLAGLCFENSDVEGAKANLLKVHEYAPDFYVEKVNSSLGEIFLVQKDYAKALYHLKILYKVSTEKQACLMKIAKCFYKTNEITNAIRSYEQAISANTKNFLPYYKLGWMQVKQNSLKDGIFNLLKAQSLENNNLNILVKLGEAHLLFEEEDYTNEAITYLSNALEIDQNNYDALIGLGKAYEKKNDFDKAIQFTNMAITQPNSNINSQYFLGMLYLKKKDL